MKVFISWSGKRSKGIADSLRKWLPGVLQAVKPYFSPDDIAKGTRWETEISKELEASRIGLLILTPENFEAPWLCFEAGALAKNLQKSRVCPLLFDMEPTDVKGPLVQFQGAKFDNAEMKRVVKMINGELGEGALAAEVLEQVFEMWWPKLEKDVAAQLEEAAGEHENSARSERDMIEEVLALTRSIIRDRTRPDISPAAIDDLIRHFTRLVQEIADVAPEPILGIAHDMYKPIRYLGGRMRGRSELQRELIGELDAAISRIKREEAAAKPEA